MEQSIDVLNDARCCATSRLLQDGIVYKLIELGGRVRRDRLAEEMGYPAYLQNCEEEAFLQWLEAVWPFNTALEVLVQDGRVHRSYIMADPNGRALWETDTPEELFTRDFPDDTIMATLLWV